jgi:hypothetical protein
MVRPDKRWVSHQNVPRTTKTLRSIEINDAAITVQNNVLGQDPG